MAIGDAFKAKIFYHVLGRYMALNLHLNENDVCSDDIPARTLCYAINEVWLPNMTEFWAADVFITGIEAQQIKPARKLPYLLNVTDQGDVLGQSVAQLSPAILSLYAFDGTDLRRSSLYFSGVPEATQGGGVLTGSGWDKLATIGSDLVAPLFAPLGMTGEWVAGHRSPTNPISFIAFQSYRANTVLGTMDRRRQKPGNPA